MKSHRNSVPTNVFPWLTAVLIGVTSPVAQNSDPDTEEASDAGVASSLTSQSAPPTNGIILNFQGAPLSEVLNYLSEAVGFVIIQEKPVTGTVNVVSHQPLSPEEAVDLINTILIDKGFVAVRNGRMLKIVDRKEAYKQDLPVRTGNDPQQIPKRDEVVTQIIPVQHADATKIVDNLKPLLGETAILTANESGNALLLTDTMTHVRRMTEIVQALDTSIASISSIQVFPLDYADANELAEVFNGLFQSQDSARSSRSGRDRFRMFRGRGDDDREGGSESEARQAASRVVAVADERSNSLVVSAPDELMPTIEQLVAQMDTNVADVTEVRVFHLENADALELAEILVELFPEDLTQQNTSGRFGGRFAGFRPPFAPGGNPANAQSQRNLLQSRVIAVGDPRTNSLLVTAARETMTEIAELVGRLDASAAKKERVYVYPLEHADVDNVAAVLRGMFETQVSGSRSSRSTQTGSTLMNRSQMGASQEVAPLGGVRSSR